MILAGIFLLTKYFMRTDLFGLFSQTQTYSTTYCRLFRSSFLVNTVESSNSYILSGAANQLIGLGETLTYFGIFTDTCYSYLNKINSYSYICSA